MLKAVRLAPRVTPPVQLQAIADDNVNGKIVPSASVPPPRNQCAGRQAGPEQGRTGPGRPGCSAFSAKPIRAEAMRVQAKNSSSETAPVAIPGMPVTGLKANTVPLALQVVKVFRVT